MATSMTFSAHLRASLVLGLPLVGGHLAQFLIGLTDTMMLGWYGVEELAALVLGGSYYFVVFLVGSGFAWAVMPMVASFAAEGDQTMIRRTTRMGLWLSIIYFVVTLPALLFAEEVLLLARQDPELSAMAQRYLNIGGWAILPGLAVMTLKSYLAALERTQVVLWVTVASAIVNAIANYALIFGNFGAPELGIEGAAIASVATTLAMLIGVLWYTQKVLPEHELFVRFWRPDTELLGRVFRLGWPIGLTNLAEVGLFVVSSIMVGWIGTVPLAAHGIAMQLATAAFMVHLGLSNAATVRAGQAFASRDRVFLTRAARAVLVLSVAMSACAITVFLLFPEPLLLAFMNPTETRRDEILAVGAAFVVMAAMFQLVDGGQVVLLGLLRGLQDTKVPMIMAAIAYWGVGLPAGYFFGFMVGFGAPGVWSGLVLGLAVAAGLLWWRFWFRSVPDLRAPGVEGAKAPAT